MESKMDRRVPVEPFAPGEYLQDMLTAKGWTQDDLADVIARSRQHINRLVAGKTAITADSAHELAKAFGTSPELWMNLQTSYELALAAKEHRDIERRSRLFEKFPVREIAKRGWIKGSKAVGEIERQICDFMGIESISDDMPTTLVARKSTEYGVDTPSQRAWFRRAELLARAVSAAEYDENRIQACISELRRLAVRAIDARQVPVVLASFGIRIVLVETIAKAKIEGVAFWLNENSPVVALSLRYDRIDNFWHNLMHELIHIKYRDRPVVDVDLGECADGDLPRTEQRANEEASHALIDPDKMESFILRNRPLYYQAKVVQFAAASGVHPGIVVGQLQRRKELDWKQLRKLLVGIRSEIVGKALTDGWGNCPAIEESDSTVGDNIH